MARKSRTAVLKGQRERKKAEKAALKRDQKEQRKELAGTFADHVANKDDLEGYGFTEDESIESIPVIVCSALGEKETVAEAESLGAVGFIVKPFTMKSVEHKFRDALAILQD